MSAIDGRCAAWAREVTLAPGGTAPRCDVFVLVEHPLPWPENVLEDPLLAEIERAATQRVGPGRAVRLQAVACETESMTRRVVVFVAGVPFAGYGRLEAAASPADLPDLVESLVVAEPPTAEGSVTDVLVCTHGSRDRCCGSLGTRVWLDAHALLPEVRVWRTSHTGGHRFAATALTFPDGNYWAYLDAPTLQGIVERTLPAATAVEHLRGCAAFTPAAQVADREVLQERGWGWLDCARFGDERSQHSVQLCFETPDGERGGYDVRLEEARRMPVPRCGADVAAATKFHSELRATRVTAWS